MVFCGEPTKPKGLRDATFGSGLVITYYFCQLILIDSYGKAPVTEGQQWDPRKDAGS